MVRRRDLPSERNTNPLHESLREHSQQLHRLESDLRAAQQQIDGLRHELRDALDRGEELLRRVVGKPQ